MKVIIISAVSKNGVIGDNGKMPWHSKEELKYFKETTIGNPVLMGRKTFEAIGAPLSGRENIILSRKNTIEDLKGCIGFPSINSAVEYSRKSGYEKCFVIGGGEIFEQTMGLADRLIISEMNFECSGNVFFPKIDEINWNLEGIKPYKEFNVKYYTKIIRQVPD